MSEVSDGSGLIGDLGVSACARDTFAAIISPNLGCRTGEEVRESATDFSTIRVLPKIAGGGSVVPKSFREED